MSAQAELEALNAELDSFNYAVSHDLRAPARAVLGYARLIEEDRSAMLDAEGRRLLAVVIGEASRIGQMIDDLLVISRLGRQTMESVAVDMTGLARYAASEQSRLSGYPPLAIEIPDLPSANGDRVLLRQVWSNLISNAAKATNLNPDAHVAVTATTDIDRVVYHVRDDGIGFNMAYADKVFGVFQKLHSKTQFPGAGVGLAIVQRIVHRHGGTVWVDARPGEGATFSFALPNRRAA